MVEANRPDRRTRRARGKSDPIDAYFAAHNALAGTRTIIPKAGDRIVEAIRALRVTRRSAVKARTQRINQLKFVRRSPPVSQFFGLDSAPGTVLTQVIVGSAAAAIPRIATSTAASSSVVKAPPDGATRRIQRQRAPM